MTTYVHPKILNFLEINNLNSFSMGGHGLYICEKKVLIIYFWDYYYQ